MKLKYLVIKISRHGKPMLYVRSPGRKTMIRLKGITTQDDPKFGPLYAAALSGVATSEPRHAAAPGKATQGSLRALCEAHFAFLSKDTTLAERTKYIRRRHLEWLCREPVNGNGKLMGDMPVPMFTRGNLQKVLDRRAERPEASNDLRKAVAALFKWAVKRDLAKENPVIGTDKIRTYSEGHRPWGQEQIEQFIERHPHGTKAYLALMLFLEAGQRRADVAGWGWQHVKDGYLVFVQQKNQKKLHKQMRIPITPELQDALETVPAGQLTFLQTEFGKPHTVAGLGTWFRRRCDEAGLKGYSAHGLRKTALIQLAEAGATDKEMQSYAGHRTAQQTEHYTRGRDQEKLAASGVAKRVEARKKNKSVPPSPLVPKGGTKIG